MTIAVRRPTDFAEPSLRDAMRQAAGGVSVVTVGEGEDISGLTVTSAASLSLDPPTMIVCVNLAASCWPMFPRHRHFCVNLLGEGHEFLADRFAGRHGIKGAARFEGVRWERLSTGAPVHEHDLTRTQVGAMRALRIHGGMPLVYSQGRYGIFSPRAELNAAE